MDEQTCVRLIICVVSMYDCGHLKKTEKRLFVWGTGYKPTEMKV